MHTTHSRLIHNTKMNLAYKNLHHLSPIVLRWNKWQKEIQEQLHNQVHWHARIRVCAWLYTAQFFDLNVSHCSITHLPPHTLTIQLHMQHIRYRHIHTSQLWFCRPTQVRLVTQVFSDSCSQWPFKYSRLERENVSKYAPTVLSQMLCNHRWQSTV